MSTLEIIVDKNGNKYWYANGKRHRTDGPSVEYINGDEEWFLNGQRHRTDGPSVVFADGYKEWWLNGHQYITFDEYVKAAKWSDDQIVEWKLSQ
jgi:hypothetical protein